VRRRPGDLLDLDREPRVPLLELGNELADDFPFPPERPEPDRLPAPAARSAGRRRGREEDRGEPLHRAEASSSQPPAKPARLKPATIGGDVRIRRQKRPLLWFSIIRTIGPWSMPR